MNQITKLETIFQLHFSGTDSQNKNFHSLNAALQANPCQQAAGMYQSISFCLFGGLILSILSALQFFLFFFF